MDGADIISPNSSATPRTARSYVLPIEARQTATELDKTIALLREMSRHSDPNEIVRAYALRIKEIFPFDRHVSLSRRDLVSPQYRITRSDLWRQDIDPWKHRDQLPIFDRGLFGELLYAGEARLIDSIELPPGDPAAEYFDQMGSMIAVPHFDDGIALNMVVHMRRDRYAFDPAQFPMFVLLSGLFGRAMKSLVVAKELAVARQDSKDQYLAMAELSDLVLAQAQTLKSHADLLEARVRERTEELEAAHLDAIYMLATASEEKDEDTARHLRRMQGLTEQLARSMQLNDSQTRALSQAAILHDVGKLHVPDEILKKPGPLTPDERRIMESHTLAGERILADRPYFAAARHVVRSHHENFNGSGYPDHLAGEAIPLEARIVHIIDVYDALTNIRPYKPAWTIELAKQFLLEQRGGMFDPTLVEIFLATQ